ncbi:MAG: GNAT family N-acetyltransferase [Chloroflexi bacterium]|nr:GNAT family N-acetyltransferase [Chloroflexota bacterium]
MSSTIERPPGLGVGLGIRRATMADLDALARLHLCYQQEILAFLVDRPPPSHAASRRTVAHALTRPTGAVLVTADGQRLYGFCTLRIVRRGRHTLGWREGIAARLGGVAARLGGMRARLGWGGDAPARPPHDAIAYLDDLYVAPEARRRGAALPLLRAAFDWARGQGLSVMEGATWADNHAMLRVAEHLDIKVTRVLLHKEL